mgnify:CR=1 FL=1
MAYQILNMDDEDITKLATSLLDSKEKLTRCKKCGCMSEGDECEICKDSARDTKTLCVVQSTKDVYALEKVKNYNGVYHVLNGVISPSLGVTPNDLNFNKLVDQIINDEIKEVNSEYYASLGDDELVDAIAGDLIDVYNDASVEGSTIGEIPTKE